jgi:hypothetical protein
MTFSPGQKIFAGVEYVIMSFGGSRESLRRFAHEIMPAFSNEPVKVRGRGSIAPQPCIRRARGPEP